MTPQFAIESLIAKGWSQQAIADAVGCSQPTINRIKSGVTPLWPVGTALIDLAKRERAKRRQRTAA
jgi:transcriptional regulator with XRE-family HTH domain